MEKTLGEMLESVRMKKVSNVTAKVFEIIHSRWPTNPLEVAEVLGEKGKEKTLSAKYLYHFRKLKEIGLIDMKKVGNTYIAWPTEIEKLRVVHELLKGL